MDEIERLKEALHLTKSRLDDCVELASGSLLDRTPISANFIKATSNRIGRVLDGGSFHDNPA